VFFVIFKTPYDECFDAARNHLERLHKKNGKNLAIWANFGLKIGEMERAARSAACERNYGADFYESFEVVTTLSCVSILC
jgi:hypothetical protein